MSLLGDKILVRAESEIEVGGARKLERVNL
jgi:hypothetical protein